MRRYPIVVLAKRRTLETTSAVAALERHFDVKRPRTLGPNSGALRSARCLVVIGDLPDWVAPGVSSGDVPPAIWMRGATERPLEDVPARFYQISALEHERLPALVGACVVEDLMERLRNAAVLSPALAGEEKLRKVFYDFLGPEPPETLQVAARRVERGDDWLRAKWATLAGPSRPTASLAQVLRACRFLRAVEATLLDEAHRHKAGANSARLTLGTYRAYFREFVETDPRAASLDDILRGIRRVETVVFGWLWSAEQGPGPTGGESERHGR